MSRLPREVLEVFATKRRDRKAALRFLKRAMKRYDRPKVIATDRLKSYRAAMNVIGNVAAQTCGRWLNNRAENSHQPFRRWEGAMAKFRDLKALQTFASVHASIHNTSTTNAISTAAACSNKTESPPWPNGVNSQPKRLQIQVLHVQPS